MMNDRSSCFPLLVVAGLIHRDRKILLAQRPAGSWMEGYWEFPGGKVQPDEDPRDALARELVEELGVRCKVGEIEEVIHHRYPDRTVLLLFFHCKLTHGEPFGMEGQSLKWVSMGELKPEEILPADRPLIEKLMSLEISP